MNWRGVARCGAIASLVLSTGFSLLQPVAFGQTAPPSAFFPSSGERIDQEYTRIIRQNLDDPRITTELVDHLPASDTVPTPLAFLGRVVGTPGELTYAKDIARYYQALAKSSPRARLFSIGQIGRGPRHRDAGDRRRGHDCVARRVPRSPCGAHRSEAHERCAGAAARQDGQADLLDYGRDALAGNRRPRDADRARLSARSSKTRRSSRHIRDNVITFITPVLEVDGREKHVDTYYFNKKRAPGDMRLPLVYWGKYVAARQQSRRHRPVLEAHAGGDEDLRSSGPDRDPRPPRIAGLSLRVDTGTGPVQRAARSDRDARVVAARRERRPGDDPARRARRVDVRLLRWLDAELHVLHRARPQRDWPVLRGSGLRT